MHPISVTAKHSTDRPNIFKDIRTLGWELTWPNQLKTQHYSSYGRKLITYDYKLKKEMLKLSDTAMKGLKALRQTGPMEFTHVFQQKLQIDGQCLAIHNKESTNITPR